MTTLSLNRPPGSGLGAKMAGGNPDPERGREADDFYSTPDAVTDALMIHYQERLKDLVVWEPCAGDGSMAARILAGGAKHVACSDINPRVPVRGVPKIGKSDLFAFKVMPDVGAVITNPPFGLAAAMIHYILTLPGGPPQFLALVLKGTYWHASSRHKLFRLFPPSAIHPLTWRPDFKSLGAPTMEICWTVWDRQEADLETVYVPLAHPLERKVK